MNSKGIFCIALLLAAAGIELGMRQSSALANAKTAEAKTIALEAEQLNMARTAIEENTDAIILQTLREQLQQNKTPEEIKRAVNSRLAALFTATEKNYTRGITVEFAIGSGGNADTAFLNENSSIIVLPAGGRTIAGEYSFTGGLLRNKAVQAEITGSRTRQLFRIPAGYTIRATVVK
ncbi:MAG: hypothetical protein NTW59_01040 [Candidatus Diapherotrites archaeon]|nr:hypothetical protein [Candidatus Diapherotrites archaeon]